MGNIVLYPILRLHLDGSVVRNEALGVMESLMMIGTTLGNVAPLTSKSQGVPVTATTIQHLLQWKELENNLIHAAEIDCRKKLEPLDLASRIISLKA